MGTVTTGKSGIHLTGQDSGWPVATASDTDEAEPKKPGDGTDGKDKAQSISGVTVTTGAAVDAEDYNP